MVHFAGLRGSFTKPVFGKPPDVVGTDFQGDFQGSWYRFLGPWRRCLFEGRGAWFHGVRSFASPPGKPASL